MKTIVAGGRDFRDYALLIKELNKLEKIKEIVSGTARGADKLGERYAINNNIPVKQFPANWDKHGKSAGYKRNEKMAKYAKRLVAFWDGKSRGTKHMIDIARKQGLKVIVVRY